MITLIGTGHIFDIGSRIRQIITARNPKAICIELDPGRYHALKNPEAGKDRASWFYRFLAGIQQRVAEEYGAPVGGEMLAAIEEAQSRNIPILLIDQDARIIVQKLWKSMCFREKIKLFFSIFPGIFAAKTTLEKELAEFEKDPEGFLARIEEDFPSIKKVLIDERNEHMAERIREAAQAHQNVLVIVGDGHVPGLSRMLSDISPEIIRLKDLRSSTDTATFSFSISQ